MRSPYTSFPTDDMNPKFSIIIPAFGTLPLFSKAIGSVLSQSVCDYEIIVTDDSSDDSVESYVTSLDDNRIIYRHNRPRLGAVRNWNAGLLMARGEYVILLHHDEELHNDNFLENIANTDADIAISDIRIETGGVIRRPKVDNQLKQWLLRSKSTQLLVNSIGPCACIAIKRQFIVQFDERLSWLVDSEWYYRLLSSSKKRVFIPENIILSHHGHKSQISSTINIGMAACADHAVLYSKYSNPLHRLYLKLRQIHTAQKLKRPSKVVKIIGGLGNQMFQYALFYELRQRFPNEELYTDTSFFRTLKRHNGLEIDRVFGVALRQAPLSLRLQLTRPTGSYHLSRLLAVALPPRRTECIEDAKHSFPEATFSPGSRYYDGYWQSHVFFPENQDKIRALFKFRLPLDPKSQHLLDYLNNNPSATSLHIRRGDYLTSRTHRGICTLDYYRRAIQLITQRISSPTFVIFSDDPAWCRDNILPLLDGHDYKLVDWNGGLSSANDMRLMAACRHNIIANSSFSWWGAFLNTNPDKIVCAPAKWLNDETHYPFQMPEWVLISTD